MTFYELQMIKTHCSFTNITQYIINYSSAFPEGNGDKVNSFQTDDFRSLVNRLSRQSQIAKKRGDAFIVDWKSRFERSEVEEIERNTEKVFKKKES